MKKEVKAVGYGRVMILQHRCFRCKTFFIPAADEYICDDCQYEGVEEEDFKVTDTIPKIVEYEQRTPISNVRKVNKRQQILKRDNYTCQYCGSTEDLSMDHVIPWIHGGSNEADNIVTACMSCNLMASDKMFDNLNQKKEYLLLHRLLKVIKKNDKK